MFRSRSGGVLVGAGVLLVCGVYGMPRLVLGDDSVVTIHDNLDGELLQRVLVAHIDRAFDNDGVIDEVLGGLPRSFLVTGRNFGVLPFALLSPFSSYVVLQLVGQAVAFLGMCLLLSRLGVQAGVAWPVALAFGSLPFYPVFGLSVAGQPTIVYALANLVERRRLILSYLLLAFFSLASSFAVAGIFIVACAGGFYLWRLLKHRDPSPHYGAGVALMAALYIASEWNLVELMVLGQGEYVAHRTSWHPLAGERGLTLLAALREGWVMFTMGQYHAPSLHLPILLLICGALVFRVVRGPRRPNSALERGAVVLCLALVTIALSHGFYSWSGFYPVKEALPILRAFNLRFYWLQSCAWYVLLAIVGVSICTKRVRTRLFQAFVALQFLWVLAAPAQASQELRDNYQLLVQRALGQHFEGITYRAFISHGLFAEIAEHIGRPKSRYRVGSVGLHPSVASFNGFYTVDGYFPTYPLSYKRRFRRAIAGELSRDPSLMRYFDSWGNRAYLFSSELGRRQLKRRSDGDKALTIRRFALNVDAFRELGGQYLFSVAEIADPDLLREMTFEGKFSHPESAWTIYLYHVRPSR